MSVQERGDASLKARQWQTEYKHGCIVPALHFTGPLLYARGIWGSKVKGVHIDRPEAMCMKCLPSATAGSAPSTRFQLSRRCCTVPAYRHLADGAQSSGLARQLHSDDRRLVPVLGCVQCHAVVQAPSEQLQWHQKQLNPPEAADPGQGGGWSLFPAHALPPASKQSLAGRDFSTAVERGRLCDHGAAGLLLVAICISGLG